MIHIVSLSMDHPSLQDAEYVMPIERAVKAAGYGYDTAHRSALPASLAGGDGAVILCGTAVGDNAVIDAAGSFDWLKEHTGPVLGICVGANLICRAFGGGLKELDEIGHVRLRGEGGPDDPVIGPLDGQEAYVTRALGPVLPEGFRALARSDAGVQAFVHKERPVYGILFHPEVRHREIISRFCEVADPGGGGK